MTVSIDGMTADPAESECTRGAVRRTADLLASGNLLEAERAATTGLRCTGLRGPDGPAVAELRFLLADCYFISQRHIESVAQVEEVLRGGRPSSLALEKAELALLRAHLSMGDAAAISRSVEQMLGGGVFSTDDALVAGALVATAAMAWDSGRATEALAHLRAAVVRSRRRPRGISYDLPDLYLVAMLTSLGEFDEARDVLDGACQLVARSKDATLAAWTHVHAARLALAVGELGTATEHARRARAFSAEVGASYYDALVTSVLAAVALAAGDSGEAQRLADACRARRVPDISVFGWAANVWMEVDLAEAQAGPARALQILGPALSRPLWRFRLLLERPHGAAWWVRTALAAGETQTAAIVMLCAEQLEATTPGTCSLAGACAHARGVYSGEIATLDNAAILYRHPWSRASAQEDAGALAARTRRGDARERLEHARRSYAECGARVAAARVDRTIKDLRVTGPSIRGHPVQAFVSERLTDAEQRVASAVAQGMTNAQAAAHLCLSRHTVDFHLRRIFRKLGISSRVELARLVAIEDSAVVKLIGSAQPIPPDQTCCRPQFGDCTGGACT